MNNEKRSMPVCFTPDQIKTLESYAKKKGMLNYNQAIEEIIGSSIPVETISSFFYGLKLQILYY